MRYHSSRLGSLLPNVHERNSTLSYKGSHRYTSASTHQMAEVRSSSLFVFISYRIQFSENIKRLFDYSLLIIHFTITQVILDSSSTEADRRLWFPENMLVIRVSHPPTLYAAIDVDDVIRTYQCTICVRRTRLCVRVLTCVYSVNFIPPLEFLSSRSCPPPDTSMFVVPPETQDQHFLTFWIRYSKEWKGNGNGRKRRAAPGSDAP